MGSHMTGWRDYGTTASFDTLDATVALNGGSVDATVEVSDDGSSVKGSTTVSLSDGGNTYDISGLPDAQYARVSTSVTGAGDLETTPEIDTYSVTGQVASGDNDQNPDTHWTLFGGKFDTSGNEFEGGGVTTRFNQ